MKEIKYTITDGQGIHARPAGELVKAASSFSSKITLIKGQKEADAKKILGIMGLGIKCGEEITVRAEGIDEEAALKKVSAVLSENL